MDEVKKHLESKLNEVIDQLGVDCTYTLLPQEEDEKTYFFVDITGEDVALLIGYHGQTLRSIQQWLRTVVGRFTASQGDESNYVVIVDVGGYRAEQDERIVKRAQEAIEQVQFLQDDFALPPMSPRHRRLVHMEVAKNQMVESHSEGEDRDRHVVISLKGAENNDKE